MATKKEKYTIICVGGWKYEGELVDTQFSFLVGSLTWLKIKTSKGIVRINAQYIVSILQPHGTR